MCKGERGAFRAGGDNVSTMTAIVGDSRTKDERVIPVRVPREAVIGTGEGKAELAGGVKWVGGKVVEKAMKARPGREGRIKLPRAEKVEGDFGVYLRGHKLHKQPLREKILSAL